MRRIAMAAALAAMLMFVAVPVMAESNDGDDFDGNGFFVSEDNGFDGFDFDEDDFDEDGFDFDEDDGFFVISDDDDEDDFDDEDFDGSGISQEIGQEADSGDVELSNEGDNSNVCAPTLQAANTGNLQNAQGFAQYDSETDDVEFEGSEFSFEPELESSCDQTIEQAASAS